MAVDSTLLESETAVRDYVVCLDFGRSIVWLVPICSFGAALVKGLSGMGEAIIFTVIWQIAFVAGVEGSDDLGLLSALICVQQCFSTAQMAVANIKAWSNYRCPGVVFGLSMAALSPLGNFVREEAPTETIRIILACVFLVFGLSKIAADGLRSLRTAKPKLPQLEPTPIGQRFHNRTEHLQLEDGSLPISMSEFRSTGSHTSVDSDDVLMSRGSDNVQSESALPIEVEINENKDIGPPPAQCQNTVVHAPEIHTQDFPATPKWLYKFLVPVGLCGGFLGGMCGMNGPPFILLSSFTSLDRQISRTVFPMGQFPEAWLLRLPMLIDLGRIQVTDLHLYALGLVASQIGIFIGTRLASKISQVTFERTILGFIIMSSISILGILQGHPRAVVALVVVVCIVLLRIVCQCRTCPDRKSVRGTV